MFDSALDEIIKFFSGFFGWLGSVHILGASGFTLLDLIVAFLVVGAVLAFFFSFIRGSGNGN